MEEKLKLENQPHPGEVFRSKIKPVITSLINWEIEFQDAPDEQKEASFEALKVAFLINPKYDLIHLEDPNQLNLFLNLFDLFPIKHQVGEGNKILYSIISGPSEGKIVNFIGPLGAGKTKMLESLAPDIGANVFELEDYDSPYRELSQKDPQYMLMAQLGFLFKNIFAYIKLRKERGITASDTGVLNDLTWGETYHRIGRFPEEDYQIYLNIVDLLKSLIPIPDVLAAIIPISTKRLKSGVDNRRKDTPSRESEVMFLGDDNPALEIQTELVRQQIDEIPRVWGTKGKPRIVPMIGVDPIKIFDDPSSRFKYIFDIRRELDLLRNLLKPQPEEVVGIMLRKFADPGPSKVGIIHGLTMFTGKSTEECLFAQVVDPDRVVGFQPTAALRFPGQEKAIISRDDMQIEATTIADNDLWSVVREIDERGINSIQTPYILIDDVMLFLAQKKAPETAIKILEEELRAKRGFHVIIAGIDLTYNMHPFTFMFNLLEETLTNPNWFEILTLTRCALCDKDAQVTRRYVRTPNGELEIDHYRGQRFIAGSELYLPVCGQGDHISCVGAPKGLRPPPFPTRR